MEEEAALQSCQGLGTSWCRRSPGPSKILPLKDKGFVCQTWQLLSYFLYLLVTFLSRLQHDQHQNLSWLHNQTFAKHSFFPPSSMELGLVLWLFWSMLLFCLHVEYQQIQIRNFPIGTQVKESCNLAMVIHKVYGLILMPLSPNIALLLN